MKTIITFIVLTFSFHLTAQFSLCDNIEFSLVADLETEHDPKDVELSTVEYNGILYYSFNDGTHGTEIWRSNGTSNGTYMISDINSGSASSHPSNLIVVNKVLLFTATTSDKGCEIWSVNLNGSRPSASLIVDIIAGPDSSSPGNFVSHTDNLGNEEMYFSAFRASTGRELWKTDGTKLGTSMVKDISPGADSSNPSEFLSADGDLFFAADNGINGNELWKTNGTAVSTVMIKDIYPGGSVRSSDPHNLFYYDDILYFAATNKQKQYSNDKHVELWKSDGTSSGTLLLKNLNENEGSSTADNSGFPRDFALYRDTVYFIARHTNGLTRLWMTDGTSGGTVTVLSHSSAPGGPLIASQNWLYYLGNDSRDLVAYNDVTGVHETVSDNTYPKNVAAHNGLIYFNGRNGSVADLELFVSAGSTVNTGLIADIDIAHSSNPQHLVSSNKLLLFAHTLSTGFELYQYDPTIISIELVKDASSNKYTESSSINDVVTFGKKIFMLPDVDPSDPIIYEIKDNGFDTIHIELGANVEDEVFLGSVDTCIFAHAKGEVELFKLSPTTGDFELFFEFADSNSDGGIEASYSIGEYLIVLFQNYNDGTYEVWSTSGTNLPMQIGLLNDFEKYDNEPVVNGTLFIIEIDSLDDNYLWISDGTLTGTHRVIDIGISLDLDPLFFAIFNDGIVLLDSDAGDLWFTDGTLENTNTIMNDDIPIDLTTLEDNQIIVSNDILYLKQSPLGLYKTDGTSSGLELISGAWGNKSWLAGDDEIYLYQNDSISIIKENTIATILEPYFLSSSNESHYWGHLFTQSNRDEEYKNEVRSFNTSDNNFYRVDFLSEFAQSENEILRQRSYFLGDQIFLKLDDGITGTELWRASCRCNTNLNIDNFLIEPGLYKSDDEITLHGATIPSTSTYFNANQSIEISGTFVVKKSSSAGINC